MTVYIIYSEWGVYDDYEFSNVAVVSSKELAESTVKDLTEKEKKYNKWQRRSFSYQDFELDNIDSN